MSEAGARVLNEPVGVALVVGNRGSRCRKVVTNQVQAIVTFFNLGGVSRTRRPMQKVRKTAENPGLSWRKRPRPESLRRPNSSGSVSS